MIVRSKKQQQKVATIPKRDRAPSMEEFQFTKGKTYKGYFVNFRKDDYGKFASGMLAFRDDNNMVFNTVVYTDMFKVNPIVSTTVLFEIKMKGNRIVPINVRNGQKSKFHSIASKACNDKLSIMKQSSFKSAVIHGLDNGLEQSRLTEYIEENIGNVIGQVPIHINGNMEWFVILERE